MPFTGPSDKPLPDYEETITLNGPERVQQISIGNDFGAPHIDAGNEQDLHYASLGAFMHRIVSGR
ncbi:MAG: hypothetical protein U5K71_09295 [Gracilimonas sp.]|nr:hypothetical protein [Gracilimonas sp.]